MKFIPIWTKKQLKQCQGRVYRNLNCPPITSQEVEPILQKKLKRLSDIKSSPHDPFHDPRYHLTLRDALEGLAVMAVAGVLVYWIIVLLFSL